MSTFLIPIKKYDFIKVIIILLSCQYFIIEINKRAFIDTYYRYIIIISDNTM